MKKVIKKLLSDKAIIKINEFRKRIVYNNFFDKSFSQEGEDMILKRIFEGQCTGFYVDVGAHHPKRFSNTYYFYQKGWSGINIDPMPDIMLKFKKTRPRDINLELGVATVEGYLEYNIYNEPALNSFDKNLHKDLVENETYQLLDIKKIQVKPLKKILEKYTLTTKIDFISIDAEGMDLQVLESNDWDKYRPKYVLVECLNFDLSNMQEDPVVHFMGNIKYAFFAKTLNTCFFKDLR